MVLTDELKSQLANCFRMYDLVSMWTTIRTEYETMGFTDQLSDKEKIEEYQWINTQLNRYISKHQSEMSKGNTLEEILDSIKSVIAKSTECTKDRKSLVYQNLRDDWLANTQHYVWQLLQDVEEEADGWTD